VERATQKCQQCALWKGTTLVFDDGPSSADLMLVGEAPGRLEDTVGRPFVGRAGTLLNTMLFEIGVRRGDVYVTNVVKHRPTNRIRGVLKNRTPSEDEIKACKPWLDEQIELVNPRLIVSLGNVPTQAILGTKEKIGRIHGRPERRDGRTIIPTYHPAGIRGNGHRLRAFLEDFAAIGIAYRGLEDSTIRPSSRPSGRL